MSRLTNKQRVILENVLYNLTRCRHYIFLPDTAIARRRSIATTTDDYVRPDGKVLCEVAKEYGSDLTGLDMAIESLTRFLYPETTKEQES